MLKSLFFLGIAGVAFGEEYCNSLTNQRCSDGYECDANLLDCSKGLNQCLCGSQLHYCDSTLPNQKCKDGTPCSSEVLTCEDPKRCVCGSTRDPQAARASQEPSWAAEPSWERDLPRPTIPALAWGEDKVIYCDSTKSQTCKDGTPCSPQHLDCSKGINRCRCGSSPLDVAMPAWEQEPFSQMGQQQLRLPITTPKTPMTQWPHQTGKRVYCDATAEHPQHCADGTPCSPKFLDCTTKGMRRCICSPRTKTGAVGQFEEQWDVKQRWSVPQQPSQQQGQGMWGLPQQPMQQQSQDMMRPSMESGPMQDVKGVMGQMSEGLPASTQYGEFMEKLRHKSFDGRKPASEIFPAWENDFAEDSQMQFQPQMQEQQQQQQQQPMQQQQEMKFQPQMQMQQQPMQQQDMTFKQGITNLPKFQRKQGGMMPKFQQQQGLPTFKKKKNVYCDSTKGQTCKDGTPCSPQYLDCTTKGLSRCICPSMDAGKVFQPGFQLTTPGGMSTSADPSFNLRQWLQQYNLAEHEAAFRMEQLDTKEALMGLDHEQLKDLGVQTMGLRNRILAAAERLRLEQQPLELGGMSPSQVMQQMPISTSSGGFDPAKDKMPNELDQAMRTAAQRMPTGAQPNINQAAAMGMLPSIDQAPTEWKMLTNKLNQFFPSLPRNTIGSAVISAKGDGQKAAMLIQKSTGLAPQEFVEMVDEYDVQLPAPQLPDMNQMVGQLNQGMTRMNRGMPQQGLPTAQINHDLQHVNQNMQELMQGMPQLSQGQQSNLQQPRMARMGGQKQSFNFRPAQQLP